MENENELATLPESFPVGQFVQEEDFDAMVRPSFLPRIQLCGGNSDIVKEGKIPVGHYALIRNADDFVDLGLEIVVVPLTYRFAAMRFGGEKVEQFFNPKSDDFKAVQAESEEKDSQCAYGPQFLVWIPSVKEFATWLLGSKSARPEARKVKVLMMRPAMLRGKLVANDRYKWHVPQSFPHTSQVEMPNPTTAASMVDKFIKEESGVVEADFKPPQGESVPAGSGERAR